MAAWLLGCASTRDTSRDHEYYPYHPAQVKLEKYRSVQERHDHQQKDLAIAMAVSGGGLRAANFGLGVMVELSKFERNGDTFNILREIDYFSTVSGGGMVVGAYLVSLKDHLDTGRDIGEYNLFMDIAKANSELKSSLTRSYIKSTLEKWRKYPTNGWKNRGVFLEHEFDLYTLGAPDRESSLLLGDIFVPADAPAPPTLPYWVPNATVFENGAIFPFAPNVVEEYYISHYTHRMKNEWLKNAYQLPAAVGMAASAAFPVALPATTLKTTPQFTSEKNDAANRYIHLFDGGIADNHGIFTAINLLQQDTARHKVLIIVDAFNGTFLPRSKKKGSPKFYAMLGQVPLMGLKSDHALLRKTVAGLLAGDSAGTDISVIYIKFGDLLVGTMEKLDAITKSMADLNEDPVKYLQDMGIGLAETPIEKKASLISTESARLKKRQKELTHRLELYKQAYALETVKSMWEIEESDQQGFIDIGTAVVLHHAAKFDSLIVIRMRD